MIAFRIEKPDSILRQIANLRLMFIGYGLLVIESLELRVVESGKFKV